MILAALHFAALASLTLSGGIALLAITLTVFEQREAILRVILRHHRGA